MVEKRSMHYTYCIQYVIKLSVKVVLKEKMVFKKS